MPQSATGGLNRRGRLAGSRLRGLFKLHLHVVRNHASIDQDGIQSQSRYGCGLCLGLTQLLGGKQSLLQHQPFNFGIIGLRSHAGAPWR